MLYVFLTFLCLCTDSQHLRGQHARDRALTSVCRTDKSRGERKRTGTIRRERRVEAGIGRIEVRQQERGSMCKAKEDRRREI